MPPQFQIVIPVVIHAQPLTGPHAYSLELVRDGVAWLGQASPMHTINIQPSPWSISEAAARRARSASRVRDAQLS